MGTLGIKAQKASIVVQDHMVEEKTITIKVAVTNNEVGLGPTVEEVTLALGLDLRHRGMKSSKLEQLNL
jgi:hypothetical protein